ncbi:MAG: flagellar filament capping protein FliD [Treponema sp.]|jgi:flagellar capping protein FliD|nr:flagellar filament capping protein FliD [Treponema sp.]
MSDVYIPGVKSRFNTEKIIDDLMKIERLPKEKAEKEIDSLENRKIWWQDLGRRVSSLRESARNLFSFQNPFNERVALSSNENVITATATREAGEGEYLMGVKQLAQADRFLSPPIDEKTEVKAGSYAFLAGKEEISVDFKGGSLKEFVDVLNRRGRGVISASFISVQPGSKSLLLESKITGSENRLVFAESAALLGEYLGITGIADYGADAGTNALKTISAAQDAVITMEGIEITRPSNTIDDIIPGVTVTARGVSDRPERLGVQPDREGVKDSIIALVGNYNRLMAELNILTRIDDRLVDELAYLDKDEADAMRKRLGAFSGDATLTQFRANLLRAVSSPYPTDEEQDLSMLAQIGVSTNTRGSGGYNPARLRGYLEIDEKVLDTAMEQRLPAIRQLFASDTDGDLLADTGVAFNLDALTRPLVDKGGLISLKTGTIDSKISQDKRRIDTMERQLAAKESDLKVQYGRMENAYARMEKMSSSLDNFSRQNGNNR